MRILLVENHQAFASVVIPAFLSEHEVTVVAPCASARAKLHFDGIGGLLRRIRDAVIAP